VVSRLEIESKVSWTQDENVSSRVKMLLKFWICSTTVNIFKRKSLNGDMAPFSIVCSHSSSLTYSSRTSHWICDIPDAPRTKFCTYSAIRAENQNSETSRGIHERTVRQSPVGHEHWIRRIFIVGSRYLPTTNEDYNIFRLRVCYSDL
jgi:hypothetical protein